MSTTEYPEGGVCDRCGMPTEVNEEGSTACTGCGNPTDRCLCEPKS